MLDADDLHQLIGDDGQEQVAFRPHRLVMIDGAQTQFGLQGAKHRFHVGESGVGAPQALLSQSVWLLRRQ